MASMSLNNNDAELNRFASEINLVDYACHSGYEVVQGKSSRGSQTLRREDKIVVSRNERGHYVYFSIDNPADNGTIIHFVQRRTGKNLGHVRKELRPWLDPSSCPAVPNRDLKSSKKLGGQAIYQAWEKLESLDRRYLAWRGISDQVIEMAKASLRSDQRGCVCMLHVDEQGGHCGWEMKGRDYTGFSAGGQKGLFILRPDPTELVGRIVVTESAIDSMSYLQLAGEEVDMIVSIGGAMSPSQTAHLESLIDRHAPGNPFFEVVAATDNDDQGEKYAEEVRSLHNRVRRAKPPVGKDWNDLLR